MHEGLQALPVGAAALPHGLVDLDVRDDQVVNIKALDLQGEGGSRGVNRERARQGHRGEQAKA